MVLDTANQQTSTHTYMYMDSKAGIFDLNQDPQYETVTAKISLNFSLTFEGHDVP